jgi:exosortase/archaeosortase family protein
MRKALWLAGLVVAFHAVTAKLGGHVPPLNFSSPWPDITGLAVPAVAFTLKALGIDVTTQGNVVASHSFGIRIWEPCAGMDGMKLAAMLAAFYLLAFRDRLRFPHALLLMPAAIVLAWLLNVARLAAIFLAGDHHLPGLVATLHDNGGWVAFAILAVVVARLPFLRAA